ncbi:hypothetical protein ACEN85_20080, partial [Curtobacterium sp. CT11-45]
PGRCRHRLASAVRATPTTPFRILGAHTATPGFRINPNPGVRTGGWGQLNVEVYGGARHSPWFDRHLRNPRRGGRPARA